MKKLIFIVAAASLLMVGCEGLGNWIVDASHGVDSAVATADNAAAERGVDLGSLISLGAYLIGGPGAAGAATWIWRGAKEKKATNYLRTEVAAKEATVRDVVAGLELAKTSNPTLATALKTSKVMIHSKMDAGSIKTVEAIRADLKS